MAVDVIEAAIRHAVAIGADPDYIALLDNFCWCSSNEPKRLWQLKEACRGAYDTAVKWKTPFISGKDSMFNDFKGYDAYGKAIKISALPTLLISALGVIPDVTKTVTEDFKNEGDMLYITSDLKAYYRAIQKRQIASGISIGRGGVEVALAKAAIGGMIGLGAKIKGNEKGIIFSASPKHKFPFAKLIGKVGGDDIKIGKTRISVTEATKAYKSTFKDF